MTFDLRMDPGVQQEADCCVSRCFSLDTVLNDKFGGVRLEAADMDR